MQFLADIISSFIYTIRPLFGMNDSCRYVYTCTQYAEYQLKTQPLHKAIFLISKRVLSCNPFW